MQWGMMPDVRDMQRRNRVTQMSKTLSLHRTALTKFYSFALLVIPVYYQMTTPMVTTTMMMNTTMTMMMPTAMTILWRIFTSY